MQSTFTVIPEDGMDLNRLFSIGPPVDTFFTDVNGVNIPIRQDLKRFERKFILRLLWIDLGLTPISSRICRHVINIFLVLHLLLTVAADPNSYLRMVIIAVVTRYKKTLGTHDGIAVDTFYITRSLVDVGTTSSTNESVGIVYFFFFFFRRHGCI